jgi:hypothetical protein
MLKLRTRLSKEKKTRTYHNIILSIGCKLVVEKKINKR